MDAVQKSERAFRVGKISLVVTTIEAQSGHPALLPLWGPFCESMEALHGVEWYGMHGIGERYSAWYGAGFGAGYGTGYGMV